MKRSSAALKSVIVFFTVFLLVAGCSAGGGGNQDSGDAGGGGNELPGNAGGGNQDSGNAGGGATGSQPVPSSLVGEWLYIDSGSSFQLTSETNLTFEKIDENLLKLVDPNQMDRFLIRSGSSRVNVRGIVADLSTGVAKASGPGRLSSPKGVGGMNVVLQNINDRNIRHETESNDDGTFDANDVISGDYEVTIEDAASGSNVKLSDVKIEGEEVNLGVITFTGNGIYNFKTELILDEEYIYDSQTYQGKVRIKNVGDMDGLGLSFDIASDDETVKTLEVQNVLGTVLKNSYRDVPIKISFNPVTTGSGYKQIKITVKISDATGKTWDDYIFLNVYKNKVHINISTAVAGVNGYLIIPGHKLVSVNTSGSTYEVPIRRDKKYKLVLSNSDISGETAYSLGVGKWIVPFYGFKETSAHEPNNREAEATRVPVNNSIVSYLHAGDIDYYEIDMSSLPSAPINVKPIPGDEFVKLTWDTVNNATAYNVYWSTTAGVTKGDYEDRVANLQEKSFTHINLNNGTKYYYVVTEIVGGEESVESAEIGVIPPADTEGNFYAPVADAGPDLTVSIDDLVDLNGRGTDRDGDSLTYEWEFASLPIGSAAKIDNAASESASFTPDVAGQYQVKFTASDGSLSHSDIAVVTAANPVAAAGQDQNVSRGQTVNLDGSSSNDPSGMSLTYFWEFSARPTGSFATFSDSTSDTPSFVADVDGEYIISLAVSNGLVTSTDLLKVTASSPVADAGPDRKAFNGSTFTLDGSGSGSGFDGGSLTYLWSIVFIPQGSATFLSDEKIVNPAFTLDRDGSYKFNLVVNNGIVDSEPDTVIIKSTTAPLADAGPDQSKSKGELVTLDGSGSSDKYGKTLTYEWDMVTSPAASQARLTGLYSVNPSFTPDVDGEYTFSVVVNNGEDFSLPDSVTITAASPVANAGGNKNISSGSTTVFDGRKSQDPNGYPLTYSWEVIDWPLGSTPSVIDSIKTPSFTPDIDGKYVISLTVNNGFADSEPDEITVNRRKSVGTTSGIFSYDFEDQNEQGNWSASNGQWQIGAPTSGPIPYLGFHVAATNLEGNYNGSSMLEGPSIQLPPIVADEKIEVSFWHWFSIYAGRIAHTPYGCSSGTDTGTIKISKETSPGVWDAWSSLKSYTGSSGGWTFVKIDISNYASAKVKLGFSLVDKPTTYNSCSGKALGWYIDEVLIDKQ